MHLIRTAVLLFKPGDDTSSHWKSAFKLKSNATGTVRTTIDASTGQTAGQVNEAISINTAGKVGIGTAANPSNKKSTRILLKQRQHGSNR